MDKEVLLGQCTTGGYFGDFEFHSKGTRICRFRAVGSCSLLTIKYIDIRKAIARNGDMGAGAGFHRAMRRRYESFRKVISEALVMQHVQSFDNIQDLLALHQPITTKNNITNQNQGAVV